MTGDIFHGLTSLPVTSLELRLAGGPDPSKRGMAALRQLGSLQQLTLSSLGQKLSGAGRRCAVWHALAFELKALTSLTSLSITATTSTLDWNDHAPQYISSGCSSLRELEVKRLSISSPFHG